MQKQIQSSIVRGEFMSKFVSKENLASAWAKIKAKIPTNTKN